MLGKIFKTCHFHTIVFLRSIYKSKFVFERRGQYLRLWPCTLKFTSAITQSINEKMPWKGGTKDSELMQITSKASTTLKFVVLDA